MKAPDLLARSPQWPAVRAAHLAKQPSCQVCGAITDLEVHHIVPFHVDPAGELDSTNLITLCEAPGHECHFVIGHLWDWVNANPDVVSDAALLSQQREAARARRGGPNE
jgi:5-methylcytosine-specific restriction endonuclease McrA